jgi:integrase
MAKQPTHPFDVKNCYYRGGDSYQIVVSKGFINGKRNVKKRTVHATSKKELETQYAKFLTEVESGDFIEPSKVTFSEFVERWKRDYAKFALKEKTYSSYINELDTRILKAIGHIPMGKLNANHLLEFFRMLQEEGARRDGQPGGLSQTTVKYYRRIISSILQCATEWKVIKENPTPKLKFAKAPKKERPFFDEPDFFRLLECLENEDFKYRMIIFLDITTGLRRGEVMGLEWKDIDFEKGTINIVRQSLYTKVKGIYTDDLKTSHSDRVIQAPPSLLAMLKQYKAWQNEQRLKVADIWVDSDRLFTKWNGEPMHPDTISKWFPNFRRKYNLPEVTFHGLRHTAATVLVNSGLDFRSVGSYLGHADGTMVAKLYGHSFRSAKVEAANMMERFLNKNNKTSQTEQSNS